MDVDVDVSVDSGWVVDDDIVDVPFESIGLMEEELSVPVAPGPVKNLTIRVVGKISQMMRMYALYISLFYSTWAINATYLAI